jgi:hypothetical protein
MNKVFKELNFWNLFIFLERDDLEADTVEKQLDALSTDFRIETGNNEYKHDGQSFQEDYSIVFFEFDLSPDYMLQLEYIPRPEGCGKYLHLKDKKQDRLHLMGWWDLDAWHPYCLREEEVLAINERLKGQSSGPWAGTDLPLLLLHDFVGFDSPEGAESFAQKVFEAFKSLGIEGFMKAEPKPVAVFYQEEEAYSWRKDAKLGYVFESKIYNCYSLRNAAHNSGEEKGRFPFEDWNKLMSAVLK